MKGVQWLRALAAGWLVWSAVSPAAAAPRPEVYRVHRNPNDVFLMLAYEGRLYATTRRGREWSLTAEDLQAWFRDVEDRPRIYGIGPKEHAYLARADVSGSLPLGGLPAAVQGYEVTTGVVYRDRLYLGTMGGGLFDDEGVAVEGFPLEIRDLSVVGGLLVAGTSEGLALFDGKSVRRRVLEGPPGDDVSALAWDGRGLWVGYFDGGLARREGDSWRRFALPGPPGAQWVNTLCWDGEALWIGTEEGLFTWRSSNGIEPVDGMEGRIQSVRREGGILVIAGSRWIAFRQAGRWERYDLSWDSLHTALAWNGRIHAGGMAGVLRRDGEKWRRFSQFNGALPDSWVTAVEPVGPNLWIGTYDAGVGILDAEGRWREMHADAWVNPNAVAALQPYVAVGTMEDGLLLWDRRTREWIRLGRGDGLPSEDVTAVIKVDGELIVGTRGGLAEIPIP